VRDLVAGTTTLVSVNSAGTTSGNAGSTYSSLSADGRVIGFSSFASDLVPNDTNNTTDVFVRNLETGVTTLVSINSAGTASGNRASFFSNISGDGRIVAFQSSASDLVANDSNGTWQDVFVRNLQTGTTILVSVAADGSGSGNSASSQPAVSADGRRVVFTSSATNLVTLNDSNNASDVFVRDLALGRTTLISVNREGTGTGTVVFISGFEGSDITSEATISANGNIIAFVSDATDLVDNDPTRPDRRANTDVFIRDVAAGTTTLVSVNREGTGSANLSSGFDNVEVSADGRFVVFDSNASDLVVNDTNLSTDVFVRDLQQPETTLVSRNASSTGSGDDRSFSPSISPDGSAIVFHSDATNLVANDTNAELDVFTFALDSDGCSYSIAPASRTSPAAGETFMVNVTAQSGCGWTAVSNSRFTSITAGADGNGNGTVTLAVAPNGTGVPRTGTVTIAGRTFTMTQPELVPEVPTVQFSQANYEFSEGAGRATVVIARTGGSSVSATVEFQTVDDPAAIPCSTASGTAYARCDYATSIDTVTFGPNEVSKEVSIPLIDDAHVEGSETVQLRLRNVSGVATLGAQSTATLTIRDNDVAGTINPVFSSPFFVRQQYLDFLSREPEPAGLQAWLNVLNNCSDVNNNPACDRIHVSSSFFRSDEFQLKGLYVFTFYKVAFNRLLEYADIIADLRRVTGQTPAEVAQKRAAFAEAFVERPAFRDIYAALAPAAYVEALLSRYGATQITTPDPQQPDGTQVVTLTAGELAQRLTAGTLTRAQVLRAVAQSREVSAAEFNNAFVAMQYYGYLRRTPEAEGYAAWLRVINQDAQNARVMVDGFMNSTEYRLRFGTP